MVNSLKLSFISNGNNPTTISLTPGETIHFGSLEFTVNHFDRLSLSPNEWDKRHFRRDGAQWVTIFAHRLQGFL
jgi:hypothetical protein